MRNNLSANISNYNTQRSVDHQNIKRNNDYQTGDINKDHQYYTTQYRQRVNPLQDQTNTHFLSTQISEFMVSQQKETQKRSIQQISKCFSQAKNLSTRKSFDRKFQATEQISISNVQNFNFQQLFHSIQLQKQILQDQKRIHEYQTQRFYQQEDSRIKRFLTTKSKITQIYKDPQQIIENASKHDLIEKSLHVTSHPISGSKLHNHQKKINSSRILLTTQSKSIDNNPIIQEHIIQIDNDISSLVKIFQRRQYYKRVFRQLKRNQIEGSILKQICLQIRY